MTCVSGDAVFHTRDVVILSKRHPNRYPTSLFCNFLMHALQDS